MRPRLLSALSLALLASVSLSACGGKQATQQVTPSPYVKGNYPGHLKIGNPYEIDGQHYTPAHDAHYVEEGIASWYGPGFHGRSTANGERFNQNAMTAAHRTLPMPSYVRVTNLENGRSEVLLVNDRGPFKKDRIIDLSKAAAEKLGVIARGTAPVRVEYLPDESRRHLVQLVENNSIRPTRDAVQLLAYHNIPETALRGGAIPAATTAEVVVAAAPAADTVSTGSGFTLVSGAQAAEPQRGIVNRAPLGHVASRSLEAPAADAHTPREEMRMARLERPAAQPTPPLSYEEGGLMPATMPEGGVRAPQPPAVIPAQPAAPAPVEPRPLQPLPEQPQPPADGLDMLTPQAKKPAQQYDTAQSGYVATSGIFIQAGSFSLPQNAHDLSRRLTTVGRTTVKPVEISGQTWYRVKVGPLANRTTAHVTLENMQNMGIRDARVIEY